MLTASGGRLVLGRQRARPARPRQQHALLGRTIPCSRATLHRRPRPCASPRSAPRRSIRAASTAAGQAWCWGSASVASSATGPLDGQRRAGRRRRRASLRPGRRRPQQPRQCAPSTTPAPLGAGVPRGGGVLGNGTTDSATCRCRCSRRRRSSSLAPATARLRPRRRRPGLVWGQNAYGKLGRGMPRHRSCPDAGSGLARVLALAAAASSICGLTAAAAAWCWGFVSGIGDGVRPASRRSTAGSLTRGHVFTAITAGYDHACGLTADGSAGAGRRRPSSAAATLTESRVPVAVSRAASAFASCARRSPWRPAASPGRACRCAGAATASARSARRNTG
jgi:hypothetical protein